MKISCTQENLNQGLLIVSHLTNKNANLPILANILIKVEDKILTLAATNLEIGVVAQVRGRAEANGDFTVNGRLLSDYIGLLPKERVDLELEEDFLKINCQNQQTKIKGQPAADFPLIPKIKKENPYIISAQEFKQALNKVLFAVSVSETRPEISGVFMFFNKEELILAATDSYRLAEKKIKLAESANGEKRIIVPVKTLQEVSRILGVFKDEVVVDSAENIEICVSDSQIMFSYNNVDLISRLIEGQYPDYQQVIPNNFKTETTVNNEELIKAVKTASLFTKNGIYDIKLSLVKDKIVITSSSAQTGENISSVAAETVGEENEIVLNYRYLLDVLPSIGSDKTVFKLIDGNSSCLVKAKDKDDYLYIVMPIKQ